MPDRSRDTYPHLKAIEASTPPSAARDELTALLNEIDELRAKATK